MMILQKTRGMSSVFEVCDAVIPENYEVLMLTNNNMNYMPPATFREVDGKRRISVKIDGLYTLAGKYGKCIPKMEDVRSLVNDLRNCILELKEYLLDPTNLIIDIKYILFDWQSMKHEFIYVPGSDRDFRDQMKMLFEEIMRIYDHQDRQGVVYLYNLYSKFLGENFTPEVFCKLVEGDFDQEEQHAYYRPAAREDTMTNVSVNQVGGCSGVLEEDYISDEEKTSAVSKVDIGLYALVMAAVVVTAFVLIIIFGTGSLKFSILMAVAAIIYIVVDVVQKNEKTEQQEIDESMQMQSVSEPVSPIPISQHPSMPIQVSSAQAAQYPSVPVPVNPVQVAQYPSVSMPNNPIHVTQYQNVPVQGTPMLASEVSDTSILSGERNVENVSKLVPREKEKAEEIYLIEGETKVGRQRSVCDFCLNDSSVSRVHAVFEKKGDTVYVRDAGSTNGTYLNEKRIVANEEVEVNPGDLIGIADIIFECC